MLSEFKRSVDDVAETLRNVKNWGRSCCLLVGAGCSVKAGIPLAQEFVDIINHKFPRAYERASQKTYPEVMGQLPVAHRRELIAQFVNKAVINWAHICIARLIEKGYVDRVLTTNFDSLVLQSCAFLNEFPAVYDFAASQLLKPAEIPDKAVFHLHGQHTGFILIITPEDFEVHSKLLKPVFEDAGEGRTWIVVGYSGENDPVFDHLARVNRFDNHLYWVGYRDNPPGKHVLERLLVPGKDAFYVSGHDADSFFISLTQRLKIFPPDLISRPFTHLDKCFEKLTPFPILDQNTEEDVTRIPRQWISSAIENYENRPSQAAASEVAPSETPDFPDSLVVAAQDRLMAGDYEGVLSLLPKYQEAPSPMLADILAWAFIRQGIALGEQAKTVSGKEAHQLLKLAIEKFQAALQIKPDHFPALNNLGLAFLLQSRTKSGDEADQLLQLAIDKLQAALQIKPEYHTALNNWGHALIEQSKNRSGDEAGRLLDQSFEKLSRVEEIKAGEASYNLACLSALRGDFEGCRTWLEKARDLGKLPDLTHIQSDSDLDSVRKQAWFQDFLQSLS